MIRKKIKSILENKHVKAIFENDHIKAILGNKHFKGMLPSIVIGLVSVIFVFMLHFLGVFDSMEYKLVDFRFNLRGPIYQNNTQAFHLFEDVMLVLLYKSK